MFLFSEGRLLVGPVILPSNQLKFDYTMLAPATTYYPVIDAVFNTSFGSPVSLTITTLITGNETIRDTGM